LQPLKWENWQRVRSRSLALQKTNNKPENKKPKNQETKKTKTKNQETKKQEQKKHKIAHPKGGVVARVGSCHFVFFVLFCFFFGFLFVWFFGFWFCLAIAEDLSRNCQWLKSSDRTMAHVQCQWLQNAVKNRTPRVYPSVILGEPY